MSVAKKLTIALPELASALADLHAKYFATEPAATLHVPTEALAPSEELLQQSALALANDNPTIVARAAWVLGQAREKRALPMLVVALEQGNQLVVADLVRAIGLIGDVQGLPALHKAWMNGVALEAVAQAIGLLGSASSLPFLLMGLRHPSTSVRIYTASAVATIVSANTAADIDAMFPGLCSRLEPSLLDIFSPVRVLMACVLAQLGRPFSNAEIRSLLEMRANNLTPIQGFFSKKPL